MKRDIITELKALRLHGMAATWADLIDRPCHALGQPSDERGEIPGTSGPGGL